MTDICSPSPGDEIEPLGSCLAFLITIMIDKQYIVDYLHRNTGAFEQTQPPTKSPPQNV